jgi:F-type H+-transporting ATPase subunit a
MKSTELLDIKQWTLSWLGLTHPFFSINPSIVFNTWIVLLVLLAISLLVYFALKRKWTMIEHVAITFARSFIDICKQALGTDYSDNHFYFITSLFLFIFIANIIIIFPWLTEPTQNLNTTLALGIISFFYTQTHALRAHGFMEYIKEYFMPFFLMFPLHLLGKLATIVSISFRLFGNIFGGAIITHIYLGAIEGSVILEILGLISGANIILFLFFGLFEGFLQAFVFTMLSLTYLSIALQGEAGESHDTEH